jgi:hypothetical protein
MAEPNEEPKDIVTAQSESVIQPEPLPSVEAPPLSPATSVEEPEIRVEAPLHTAAEDVTTAASWRARLSAMLPTIPRIALADLMSSFAFSRRVRRRAALAATVLFAAGLGAAIGGVALRPAPLPPPKPDTAALEHTRMLERTVARLSKELATIKGNLETAARDNRAQLAKLNEKLAERTAEITASIAKPATAPAAPAEKPQAVAPIPTPRPALVSGWSVVEAQNGRALLANRGELFEVRPGIPLPGVGRVEEIRREGDKWVVLTTKGLITQQDEHSAALRPARPAYPPYFRPY